MIYEGATYYFMKNLQGDVVGVFNSSGTLLGEYVYDAWGRLLNSVTNDVLKANPFRYRGYYYDSETALYYLNSRYYDPEAGRFLNMDGLSYLEPETFGGLNLYAYCGNNPVMFSDPSGNSIILSTIAIMLAGAFIGATVSAGVSIVTQAIFNEGQINWTSVIISAVSGFINGALSASPLSVGWLMVAGGVLGAATYIADSQFNHQDITFWGMVSSIGFGILSAKIGDNGANHMFKLSNSIKQVGETINRELRRKNQEYAQKEILRRIHELYSDLLDTVVVSTLRFYIGSKISMIFDELF